jgi:hypothetical protein
VDSSRYDPTAQVHFVGYSHYDLTAHANFVYVIATAVTAQFHVTMFSGHYGQQLRSESRTCKIYNTLDDSSFIQIRYRL